MAALFSRHIRLFREITVRYFTGHFTTFFIVWKSYIFSFLNKCGYSPIITNVETAYLTSL